RSELAREKLTGTAFIQEGRVTVDVFREQARSYKKPAPTFARFCRQNRYQVINAGRHCKKPKNGTSSVSQTASNTRSTLYSSYA
ncbi:hypothetical protein, partial [Pseudomonas sp. PS01296]|uniref:hypothetical protein n=1 Tax=Pseudomonas sp. PS01296 TaxID=2991432 RepID=UPI00249ADD18